MNQSRISSRITALLIAALITVCGMSVHAQAQMVPYPLGTLPAGFAIHWPTPPKITRSVDVTKSRYISRPNASVAVKLRVA